MTHRPRLYSRVGDTGTSTLADGQCLSKDHPRFEAMGALDHLNSQLGLLLAELNEAQTQWPSLHELIEAISPCQYHLFDLGSELSLPSYQQLSAQDVLYLERNIDHWTQRLEPLRHFILPGGSILIAQTHIARTLARTAERRLQSLQCFEQLRPECLAYLNRLSDFLFAAARLIGHHQKQPEVLWQALPSIQNP